MGSRTAPECLEPTTALRERSPDRLRADLAGLLVELEPEVAIDIRDVLVALAGWVDCARRLGLDPAEVFDAAVAGRSDAMQELARTFARRDDVRLEAFAWRLEDRPDGPCYRPEPAPSRYQLHRRNRP